MIDLSLAPMANMVFLSLTGSHGLPLALANMDFLSRSQGLYSRTTCVVDSNNAEMHLLEIVIM